MFMIPLLAGMALSSLAVHWFNAGTPLPGVTPAPQTPAQSTATVTQSPSLQQQPGNGFFNMGAGILPLMLMLGVM